MYSILLYTKKESVNKDTCINEDIMYTGLKISPKAVSWQLYIDLPETEYFYDKIQSSYTTSISSNSQFIGRE